MVKPEAPKVEYAKKDQKEEKLPTKVEAALLAPAYGALTPEQRDLKKQIAAIYDLPLMGVNLIKNRPYVNMTGLDDKIHKKWLSQGWIKSEVSEQLQKASRENKFVAGYAVKIAMFDRAGYSEDLKAIASNSASVITPELIKALRESRTIPFRFEGWASPETTSAIAYKYEGSPGQKRKTTLLVENVQMMAERKSSNRTKRAATDCGLTSVEEMVGVDSGAIDVEFEPEKEAPKKRKPRGKKEAPPKEEAPEQKEEEAVAKEEPAQKSPEVKKEERPVQASDVAWEKGKYDPNGPPTEYQWKLLDKIHEAIGDDNYRHVLDIEGVTLESELTLSKAEKIIKENPTKKKEEDELPLDG